MTTNHNIIGDPDDYGYAIHALAKDRLEDIEEAVRKRGIRRYGVIGTVDANGRVIRSLVHSENTFYYFREGPREFVDNLQHFNPAEQMPIMVRILQHPLPLVEVYYMMDVRPIVRDEIPLPPPPDPRKY